MKMLRYIFLLAGVVLAASCSLPDIDEPTGGVSGDKIQVVGRVTPFADHNVATRAFKVGDEGNTACMCLAIFDSDGVCERMTFEPSSSPTFTIDKSQLDNGDQIYIFANVSLPRGLGEESHLQQFLDITSNVSGIDIPEITVNGTTTKCFPMVGKIVISDKENIDPILRVDLESVYAKVMVNILSKPDQKADNIDYASFSLTGYEVHNVAEKVDFNGGFIGSTNDETTVSSEVFQGTYIVSDFAQSDDEAQFYFYLPERFLQPAQKAHDGSFHGQEGYYTYPFTDFVNGKYRDEDMKFRQRYKPMLVKDQSPAATFVRIFGEYIDHQGHNWNVSYDIYVGEDEYGNFDIERNKQYNNIITIKGISTSQDETVNQQSVSIDHRVDIERVNPVIVNLRRETLLDSHFEVRPLRIRLNDDFKGQDLTGAKVTVEVIYEDSDPAKGTPGSRWIGLERSFGNGVTQTGSNDTWLVDSDLESGRKNAAGKRKYFTTDLTYNTLATDEGPKDANGYSTSGGQKVVVPITGEAQVVWIYVDECIAAGDDVRSAVIRVTSTDSQGRNIGEPVDYQINQRLLFPVTFTNGTDATSDDWKYYIEYHEEYLHNYDAEDSFGQTEYEGMQWGLLNTQLSYNHRAMFMNEGGASWMSDIIDDLAAEISPFYDFYLTQDNKGTTHSRSGYDFCIEIIDEVNGNTTPKHNENSDDDIKELHLSQDPKSAIEYCFNKNKRQPDGSVKDVDLYWYLPAIDEVEEIVMSQYGESLNDFSYSLFPDFRNKYYWSSQPAYIQNYAWLDRDNGGREGTYMIDNPNYARATKVLYNGGGASNPNNYDKELSGMSGYVNLTRFTVNQTLGFPTSVNEVEYLPTPYTFTYTIMGNNIFDWNTYTVNVPEPKYDQKGYLHRTKDMARVRCVRKL